MHAKQLCDLHPRGTVKVRMTAACILMQLRSLGYYVARLSCRILSHYTREMLHVLNQALIYTGMQHIFSSNRMIKLTCISKWMQFSYLFSLFFSSFREYFDNIYYINITFYRHLVYKILRNNELFYITVALHSSLLHRQRSPLWL